MSTKANQKRTSDKQSRKPTKAQLRARRGRSSGRGLSVGAYAAIGIVVGVLVLGGIFYFNNRPSGKGGSGEFAFQVGTPGPGEEAPPIELPSATGGSFSLASLREKNVLLYFQEGLMCQPCWDQIKDIERDWAKFQALGIDEVVTITTDPLDGLEQKVRDERLSTPVLSDRTRQVSESYETTSYGMMGEGFNGHSFILVGPDGKIRWRADYGGPPDYTMFLPVKSLLADIRAGLKSER
ncbi:MAG: peroxiredoxin family protein [Candidatus Methylomirabilales bacterium]